MIKVYIRLFYGIMFYTVLIDNNYEAFKWSHERVSTIKDKIDTFMWWLTMSHLHMNVQGGT